MDDRTMPIIVEQEFATEEFETRFSVISEGRVFIHNWKVTEVIPLKAICYTWLYYNYIGKASVTFHIKEIVGKALLTVTCLVLDSFDKGVPEFSRESCLAGWKYFIQQRLVEYLDSRT